jgi:hypothetical protein
MGTPNLILYVFRATILCMLLHSFQSSFLNLLNPFLRFLLVYFVFLFYLQVIIAKCDNGIFYVLLTMHLVILCNENKIKTLFIFNLFRQSTSTCFGHVYCPSSGGIHCICPAFVKCYTFKLTGYWPGQDEFHPDPANCQTT